MVILPAIYLDALFLLLGDNSERSRSLVKELIEVTEKNDPRKDIITPEDELVEVYKSLIKSVISEKIDLDNKVAAKMLLLKVTSNETLKSHPVVREALIDILNGNEPISAEQIHRFLGRIRNILILAAVDQGNRKIFASSKKVGEIQDSDAQASEIMRLVAVLTDTVKLIDGKQNETETKASETYVKLSDPESIKRAITTYVDRNVRGVIKTGLQGLNRALGVRGGVGRGESIVFPASSHNYKSGMLVSFMFWTVIHNKIEVEPGKKPMVYFVSLENEVSENLMDVFKALYGRTENKHVDFSVHDTEFITNWLVNYFAKFDVELLIDRYTPHEFSFGKFLKRYNSFVEQGYEIVAFILDYLSEARGIDPGDTISTQGTIQLIKENYTKFFNHAKTSGYMFATGHQLTKKAEEIAASYKYPVKKFNYSLMADSSDVHRIVDCIVFLQLENNTEGQKFLTMQLRKNRGCKDTKETDKFCAYPFTEFGIVDDLGGVPQYLTDIDAYNAHGAMEDEIAEAAMF